MYRVKVTLFCAEKNFGGNDLRGICFNYGDKKVVFSQLVNDETKYEDWEVAMSNIQMADLKQMIDDVARDNSHFFEALKTDIKECEQCNPLN